jgi:hypothetical protein
MTRVVLGSNVPVSAGRAECGALAVIREGCLPDRFQVYVSDPLQAEAERPHAKPYFVRRLRNLTCLRSPLLSPQ